MIPSTVDRVAENTADCVNEQIRRQFEAHLARYGAADPATIEERLRELDNEWDIERCLETMASSFTLLGLTLGIVKSRRFLAIPLVVQAFFLQHAVQGWCPPLPVLRRLGIRTAEEIAQERYALKALRGDFADIEPMAFRNDRAAIAAVSAAVRR